MQIKVASYNIRKSVGLDWKRKPERVLGVLTEIDADVIALQEVDRRFGSRLSSLDATVIEETTAYRAVRFGTRPQSLGFHGNALLVRKGIEVVHAAAIELPFLEPRGAASADLLIKGQLVRIVGIHLGLMREWRRRQTEALVQKLAALEKAAPTIIMGDMNEWKNEPGVMQAFEAAHHVAVPGPSFHASMPMLALDRIIATRDIHIEDSGVHRSTLSRVTSDHLPIWASVRVISSERA